MGHAAVALLGGQVTPLVNVPSCQQVAAAIQHRLFMWSMCRVVPAAAPEVVPKNPNDRLQLGSLFKRKRDAQLVWRVACHLATIRKPLVGVEPWALRPRVMIAANKRDPLQFTQ